MNILIITQLYPEPDDEGDNKPTKTVEYFAKEWKEMGHEIVVFHCPSKFPLPFYYVPKFVKEKLGGASSNIIPSKESRRKIHRKEYGYHIFRYPMLKMRPGGSYLDVYLNKCAKRIEYELDKLSFVPDLVVGHFANPSTGLVAKLSKFYNSKSSIVFHNDCNERNLVRHRLKEYLRDISAIGARSVIEQKEIKQLLGLEKDPFLCYSGVPNDAIEAAERECDKHEDLDHKYIYVGSMISRKYLDKVVEAFSRIEDPDKELIIVGGGPEEKRIKDYVASLGIEDKVVFKGRVPREQVLQELKKGQIFTLISSGEVFGMVYIESMLQGCVTIASKGGGFDGIIKDGYNGFLCEPGDADMLFEVFKRIQKLSREEKNLIGQRAIETAINFSEREVAENYLTEILNNQE